MNLWAKSVRQLAMLTVALFFFSCEDENSILGFKNPNKKFDVNYLEIPLESSVVLIDSLITDNADLRGVTLLGQYQDNTFGNVKATSFVQVYPAVSTVLPSDATYDSVTVQFRLNFYGYGFTGEREEKFNVYEVKVPALSTSKRSNYYFNTEFKHNPELLGQGSVTVNYDTLKKYAALQATAQDTILATAKLSNDYGLRLFNAAKSTASGFDEFDRFKYEFNGLVVEPFVSAAILGLNLNSSLSQVTIHYHTPTATKLTKVYNFGAASYTSIDANRSGTELNGFSSYQSFDPASGLRYVQSGSPIVTRLDLTNFYTFADALDNALINSAELVINNVASPETANAHNVLGLRILGDDNQFQNVGDTLVRKALSSYNVITVNGYNELTNGRYYMVNSDVSSAQRPVIASIAYSSDNKSYSGFMTFFVQSLFNNRKTTEGTNTTRIQHLALYPLSPSPLSSVTRTVFHKDDVKLRIFYTQPTQLNP